MMISTMLSPKSEEVKHFISHQLQAHMHSKRRDSLSDAVIGVLTSGSLQPSKIGRGLAAARGILPKHAIKQIDRFLSNEDIRVQELQSILASLLVGQRQKILVAMDWTVFAKDAQMTLTIRLVTKHGRATPLLWKTVSTKNLKDNKTNYAFVLLEKLRFIVSRQTQVIVLADREFGTLNNMKKMKDELGFDYILRIKRNFTVANKDKEIKKLAHEWVKVNEAICIDNGYLTIQEYPVEKIVIAKEPEMKDTWYLACSTKHISTKTILNYYGKRWGTETSYRDEKDLRFGLGLKKARIKTAERRDRLFLVSAIAIIFLTLLGAASEMVGFDRYIRANTTNIRTHSLFTQGLIVLDLLINLRPEWKERIRDRFLELISSLDAIYEDQYII